MKRIIFIIMMIGWILNGLEARVVWKSDVILGRVSAVEVNDRGIFISDRKQFAVFHLNHEGRLIRRFGARGEGPGEFRSMMDMAVCDGNIYINDYYSIKCFDLEGHFVKQTDMANTGQFARLRVCSTGFIFLGAPPQKGGDNAALFMKSFEDAGYNLFHYLPFDGDKLRSFGKTLPQLKGQQAPSHIRNFFNIPYIVQQHYIYYINNIRYGIWRITQGKNEPEMLIEEDLPYFIPYACEIEVQQNKQTTITTTKKMDLTLIRLFPTEKGFCVYLSNDKANRLRHYRFKNDRLYFVKEIADHPADNVLAYYDDTFYGLADDTLTAFTLQ